MATYNTIGITLFAYKYKGTERLASFYTTDRGKVQATVSGVGRPGSKLAPAIEPLTLSKLFLVEGRKLDRLTQCEVLNTFYDLRRDLHRLALASYTAELVARTTEPGEPDPVLFDALNRTLSAMCSAEQPELTAWAFVLRYLDMAGIVPVIDCCVACMGPLDAGAAYMPALGGCVCKTCGGSFEGGTPLSARTRGALHTMLTMPPDRIDRLKLAPGVQGEVRELLRRHIRYHLGVELKTEKFLEKMGRAGPAA